MIGDLPLPPPIVHVAPREASPRAFTRQEPNGTWPSLPRSIRIVLPLGPFADDATIAEATVAARAWSEVRCSAVRLVVERARGEDASSGDGLTHVVFHRDTWPTELVPRALAQTVVVVDGRGNLTDADVHLNGKDYVFSLDGAPGTIDLRSILIHELGHAIGIGHSADPSATMTPAASGTRFRSIEADDEAAACALYPGRGATRCPDVACPSPFACLAGSCERRGAAGATCAPCLREVDACAVAGATARCVDLDDGSVCARACDDSHPCGAGFRCLPTTAAGDLQCIADDGCRALGAACASDVPCGNGFVCASGRCVGARAPHEDAGVPPVVPPSAAPDAPIDEGCNAGGADTRASLAAPLALAIALSWTRRRRRA